MLNLKKELAEDIGVGVKAVALPDDEKELKIVVERSDNSEHGDYASPVALVLAKCLGKNPMDIVKEIAAHMPKKEYIGRITAAKPGYLNVWLNPGWLTARLDDIVEGDLCCDVTAGEGRSANLEFISANPTGPLTLGNIRTAFSVDTLGNVLECAGYDVTREYYFNDAGAQVRALGESVLRRALQAKGLDIDYPAELYQGDYITEVGAGVAEKFKENEGKEFSEADLADAKLIGRIGKAAAVVLMSGIKKMIKDDLRIEFDVWTSEEELRNSGKVDEALERLHAAGVIYEKDGAKFLKTTDFGDSEDRVVVKSDGEMAYIAPDIAYHHDKYERGFSEIFTFVGADHQGHLPKIKAAMKVLGRDVSRLHLIAAQWLSIMRDGKPVKLSKRAGQIVTPRDLISEVGYDAARFFMVQHSLTSHMDFDLDLARERSERNPVYYVQYAYVRLQSILRRAKQQGVIAEIGPALKLSGSLSLTHTLELGLMRQLYRFPEVVSDIAQHFDVHDITYYAKDLAKAVHVFYRHVPVLAVEDTALVTSRLQLVLAARSVLGKTLDLLGLGKPDVM